jgi:protein TonB
VGKANPQIGSGKKTHAPFSGWLSVKLAFSREHNNLTLGVLIIVLAILLGWTIGRGERESARQSRAPSNTPAVKQSQRAVTPAEANSTRTVPVASQSTPPAASLNDPREVKAKEEQPAPESETQKNHVKPRHSPASKLVTSGVASNDLVIFDSGKRVFPMKSLPSQPFSDALPASEEQQANPKSKHQETPVSVSEDVAEQHLLNRIEPDYPEDARAQHLQGTVVLDINVGKDGAVHSLSRVAGDSQLALLAAKAVRRWKFAPLVRGGTPVGFESQVTLSFALP